jgi:hypothetical protein
LGAGGGWRGEDRRGRDQEVPAPESAHGERLATTIPQPVHPGYPLIAPAVMPFTNHSDRKT